MVLPRSWGAGEPSRRGQGGGGAGDGGAVWQGLLPAVGWEHHLQDHREGAAGLLQPVSVSPCACPAPCHHPGARTLPPRCPASPLPVLSCGTDSLGPLLPMLLPCGSEPCAALAHPGPIPAVFCLPRGERWCGLSAGQAPETPPRRFGKIQSIRMLPGKHCAFINFKQKAAAEAAYEDMLVSTGPGGPTAPPGPCAHRGCSSTDVSPSPGR